MSVNEYYSNGKLLLTGEYLVLEGALALALPLKLGQSMKVRYLNDNFGILHWNTYVQDQLWFQATFGVENIEIITATDRRKAYYIRNILVHAAKLVNEPLNGKQSKIIETYLDFSPELGLGSSSSLISNLAYWLNIDPFKLFRDIFEGSAYDIACARAKGPIFYQLSKGQYTATQVNYNPSFGECLYFVYLGKKANSPASIQQNKDKIELHKEKSCAISALTQNIINAASLEEFEHLITEHETIMSEVLGTPPVKTQFFSDFPGAIKSLGAWGGDFILATSKKTRISVEAYFRTKGLNIMFGYHEIVL